MSSIISKIAYSHIQKFEFADWNFKLADYKKNGHFSQIEDSVPKIQV